MDAIRLRPLLALLESERHLPRDVTKLVSQYVLPQEYHCATIFLRGTPQFLIGRSDGYQIALPLNNTVGYFTHEQRLYRVEASITFAPARMPNIAEYRVSLCQRVGHASDPSSWTPYHIPSFFAPFSGCTFLQASLDPPTIRIAVSDYRVYSRGRWLSCPPPGAQDILEDLCRGKTVFAPGPPMSVVCTSLPTCSSATGLDNTHTGETPCIELLEPSPAIGTPVGLLGSSLLVQTAHYINPRTPRFHIISLPSGVWHLSLHDADALPYYAFPVTPFVHIPDGSIVLTFGTVVVVA